GPTRLPPNPGPSNSFGRRNCRTIRTRRTRLQARPDREVNSVRDKLDQATSSETAAVAEFGRRYFRNTVERKNMHPPAANKASSPALENPAYKSVFSKIDWRLIPLLLIAYMVAYLDRINIGYAQLQMKQSLPFEDAVYALGAGIFFIGYFLFEVPSNLLLERIGARTTLLRIMVLWGLAACAMMFVSTPLQFYVVRFLLGAFEAGFFPGVILYFTYWYPSVRRGQVIAIFMSATTIVSVIAGPLCGFILKYFDGFSGLHGWQWLFLVQGLPAIILGFLVFL